jgi:hypothetical protein
VGSATELQITLAAIITFIVAYLWLAGLPALCDWMQQRDQRICVA